MGCCMTISSPWKRNPGHPSVLPTRRRQEGCVLPHVLQLLHAQLHKLERVTALATSEAAMAPLNQAQRSQVGPR